MKKYYFISGLPRSGSTLLSSILSQNPRFTSSISDPLFGYVNAIIRETETSVGLSTLVSSEKQKTLMRGLFDSFYQDDTEVCFNTNRSWVSNTSLLKQLYPDFRMIVCVREIPWILDSFERLERKNPFTIKPLYHHQQLGSVYDRCAMLMGETSFTGYVVEPLKNVIQSLNCEEAGQILYVEYSAIAKYPEKVMKRVYEFLGEEYFDHNFNDVEKRYNEYDESAKIKDLHSVRAKVNFESRDSILPVELFQKYLQNTFWLHEGFDKSAINWIDDSIGKQMYSNVASMIKY